MKKFLLIGAALAALSISALADGESSYMFVGLACLDKESVPKLEKLLNKYNGDINLTFVASTEHDLPCLYGTFVSGSTKGSVVSTFSSEKGIPLEIIALPFGNTTMFSYQRRTEPPKVRTDPS